MHIRKTQENNGRNTKVDPENNVFKEKISYREQKNSKCGNMSSNTSNDRIKEDPLLVEVRKHPKTLRMFTEDHQIIRCFKLIKERPEVLSYIEHFYEPIFYYMVYKDWRNLKYIKKQDRIMCELALWQSKDAIEYCNIDKIPQVMDSHDRFVLFADMTDKEILQFADPKRCPLYFQLHLIDSLDSIEEKRKYFDKIDIMAAAIQVIDDWKNSLYMYEDNAKLAWLASQINFRALLYAKITSEEVFEFIFKHYPELIENIVKAYNDLNESIAAEYIKLEGFSVREDTISFILSHCPELLRYIKHPSILQQYIVLVNCDCQLDFEFDIHPFIEYLKKMKAGLIDVKDVPIDIATDEEYMELVKYDGSLIGYIPKQSQELILQSVQTSPHLYYQTDNDDLLEKAVAVDGSILYKVDKRKWTHKIIEAALQSMPSLLQDKEIPQAPSACVKALKVDPLVVTYIDNIPKEVWKDAGIEYNIEFKDYEVGKKFKLARSYIKLMENVDGKEDDAKTTSNTDSTKTLKKLNLN